MLKTCASQIAPALTAIFQRSVDSGKLPSDWLNANISPVHKKGDVHLPENYRPVSLTCVSCKILEHIICKHILDNLEQSKILTSLNRGYRSGYSCETQLVTTVHDLLGKFGNGSFRPRAVSALSRFGLGSFRPGSFRPGSIRPWVVSAKFGGPFCLIFLNYQASY